MVKCVFSMHEVVISNPSVMKHLFHSSIEVEARGSEVQGHPGLQREIKAAWTKGVPN